MVFRVIQAGRGCRLVTLIGVITLFHALVFLTVVQAFAGNEVKASAASAGHTQIPIACPAGVVVNSWNGNAFYSVTILEIPGRGLSLKLDLSYNSSWHDYKTHYGYGWQFSYNIFYERAASGDITVYWGDGSSDVFESSEGGYIPIAVGLHVLWEPQPGTLALERSDGLTYYFESPVHKHITRIVDRNENSLAFTYDADMLLTTITDAVGRQVHLDYTGDLLTSLTDPNVIPNRTTTLQYDGNSDLIGIVDPLGATYSYDYNGTHHLTSITDPLGGTTDLVYSGAALAQVSGSEGSVLLAYLGGNATEVSMAGETRTLTYDDAGRIIRIVDGLGNAVTIDWQEGDNVIKLTDPEGNSTEYGYADGHLVSITDAEGQATNLTYEPDSDRLATVTDARGRSTVYEYDDRGNLTSIVAPLGTTGFQYDLHGNVVARTDPNGFTTTYNYDGHGNLTDFLDISFTYDNVGRVTGVSNSEVSVRFTYDHLSRILGAFYDSFGKSVQYDYDAAGRRVSMTDPDGGITLYEYDDSGNLARLVNPTGQVATFVYDDAGRLARKDHSNGAFTAYSYDDVGRLVSLVNSASSGEVVSSYSYEYDGVGNRTALIDADEGRTEYHYDRLYQLVSVTYPHGGVVEYSYDEVGNRVSQTDSTGTTVYVYDGADRLLSAGDVSYGWDSNGNMISKTDASGTTQYEYDAVDRLTEIKYPDGKTNGFTYYPDGRRLARSDSSGNVSLYFYDGPNALIEADDYGNTETRYTSGLWMNEWLSLDSGGSSSVYIVDGAGSVVQLLDSDQHPSARYQYDAFGSARLVDGQTENPFRFMGMAWDQESELYHNWASYYNPALGKAVSDNLLIFPPGFNTRNDVFSYAARNSDEWSIWRTFGKVEKWLRETITKKIIEETVKKALLRKLSQKLVKWLFKAWSGIGLVLDIFLDAKEIGPGDEIPPEDRPTGPPGGGHGEPPPGPGDTGGDDPGTGGSGESGIESHPLATAPSEYLNHKKLQSMSPVATYVTAANRPHEASTERPSKSDHEPGQLTASWYRTQLNAGSGFEHQPRRQLQSFVDLSDLLPTTGPAGTTPVVVVPHSVLGGATAAVDALAVDFVSESTGKVKASVLGVKTIGNVYSHDYSICNRFHGYHLETAAPVPIPLLVDDMSEIGWFWYLAMTKDSLLEETFLFTVYVDEDGRDFIVDSRWLADHYPDAATLDAEYVLAFHATATTSEEAYSLVQQTLDRAKNHGAVQLRNLEKPPPQMLLMRGAELVGSKIELEVYSWLDQALSVDFHGTGRYYTDHTESVPFLFQETIEPGLNSVALPVGDVFDAVLHMELVPFHDKVYVGAGYWFAFDDSSAGGTSHIQVERPDCDSSSGFTSEDIVLGGCAAGSGYVRDNGWVGLGRALSPNGLAVDIRQNQALSFRASGDGKSYRVLLESDAVEDFDYYQHVITTHAEPRQYVIPFSRFRQRGFGRPEPFTGADIKNVVWLTIGDPLSSVALVVDRVGMFNSVIISNTTVHLNTTDTDGPYRVETTVSGDVATESVVLFFSLDNGVTFVETPMTKSSGDVWLGSVPGQPLGTEIRYFVQATDVLDNIATDPVDVPFSTYRFQVSEKPYLLVDDFYDTDPTNLLGNHAALFVSENGGVIRQFFDKESLRLDWDASATESWVAYASFLGNLDCSPYKAVQLLAKGSGKQPVRIGFADTADNEPKVLLDQYLSGGLTTSWQMVRIPIQTFPALEDWSSMDRIVLGFENRSGCTSGNTYIDEIRFIPDLVPLVIDNFDGRSNENGLGGGLWTAVVSGADISVGYNERESLGGTGACLRLTYRNIDPEASATWGTELAGLDAGEYDTLAIMVKGFEGGEKPNLYLGDGSTRSYVDLENYGHVSRSWQRFAVPMSDFSTQGLDITALAQLEVVFEWESMAGTIYIDDLKILPAGESSVGPIVSAEPSVLDFGRVSIGASRSLPVEIYNFGNEMFRITTVETTDGVFSTDFNGVDGELAPGQHLKLSVTCVPAEETYYQDSLLILSNTLDIIVPLRGGPAAADVDTGVIAGGVMYYTQAEGLGGVSVALAGAVDSRDTTVDGWFQFEGLPNGDYTVTPSRSDDASGLDIRDVVVTLDHLAGSRPLSGHQLLAGDVNCDSRLSVADAVKMMRCIVQLENIECGNWVFVDRDFSIDGVNWSTAPTTISTNLSGMSQSDIDFLGIRKGDVNGDHSAAESSGRWERFREGQVTCEIEAVALKGNDRIVLPMLLSNDQVIGGLQVHLQYDPSVLTFEGLSSDLLAGLTVNPADNEIHIAWADIEHPLGVSDKQALAELSFGVHSESYDTVSVTFSRALATDLEGMGYRVATSVGGVRPDDAAALPDGYRLEPNYPNPFNVSTRIRFSLPVGTDVRLDVFNMTGQRVVTLWHGFLEAGEHSVTWNGRGADGRVVASGTYLYHFVTGQFTGTGKMVLLK